MQMGMGIGALEKASYGGSPIPPPPPPGGHVPTAQSTLMPQATGFYTAPPPPPPPLVGGGYTTFAQMQSPKPSKPPQESKRSKWLLKKASPPSPKKEYERSRDKKRESLNYSPLSDVQVAPQVLRERTLALVALQTFEGSFPFTSALAALLGTTLVPLEAKLRGVLPTVAGLNEEQRRSVWATLLAVGMFEGELVNERDVWELVVEKAKDWITTLNGVDVETGVKLVMKALDEVRA